ncbi:hypothetical protein ACFE04_030073 [Oxalis oulophora]
MGLRRVEAEEEFQGSPEKFYHIWRKTPHHTPEITGKNIQSVKHHDGDWDTHGHGSVKTWNYTIEGKDMVLQEKVELDDENLKVTHVGVDGDVFQYYKSFVCGWQYIPKGNGTLVKITIEYEKLSDDKPDAISYINFIIDIHKDIQTHLTEA